MFFTDANNNFKIVSVLNLELPAQNTIIPPRPYHILSFRLSGNAHIETPSVSLHLSDNSLFYIPAGASYHIASDKEQLIVVNFEMTTDTVCDLRHFSPVNQAVFQELFLSLDSVWSLKKGGYYFHAMSHFYNILGNMYKQFSSDSTASYSPKIKEALNYLHLHYRDASLSITDLCSISNLSDTQFRKIFNHIYNTTPLSYINMLRVGYAADLLLNTSFSVEKIAELSGFADPKYFSTVFKKLKNTTPSNYRKSI